MRPDTSFFGVGTAILATVGVLLLSSGSSDAYSPAAPTISAATIRGTWEAVIPELPRLYVLEVDSVEEKRVRMVVSTGPGIAVSIIFKSDSITLDGGHFMMHGRGQGSDRAFSIDVNLAGTAVDDSGSIEGTVTITRVSDPRIPSARRLVFVKRGEGLVQWLSRTRAQAEEMLKGR